MKRRTTQELTALAREVPWRELDRPAVDRVRANLREMALAAPPENNVFRDHRRTIAATVLALAAAAVVIAWAIDFGARTARQEDRTATYNEPEVVRLTDGHLQVRAVERGARPMRVVIGDAELEARAADFEVFVENDRLVSVFTAAGMVEVTRLGVAPMILQPGVRWVAQKRVFSERRLVPAQARRPVEKRSQKTPVEERAVAIAPVPTSSAGETPDETPPIAALPEPPAVQQPPIAAKVEPAEPETDELNFQKGWGSYRTGLYAEAARYFSRVDPRGPWGEDAAYWRVHATLGHKEELEAEPLIRNFLDRYPKSARRGELAVVLGWILVDEDRSYEARKLFKLASDDPNAAVRESARRGYVEADDD